VNAPLRSTATRPARETAWWAPLTDVLRFPPWAVIKRFKKSAWRPRGTLTLSTYLRPASVDGVPGPNGRRETTHDPTLRLLLRVEIRPHRGHGPESEVGPYAEPPSNERRGWVGARGGGGGNWRRPGSHPGRRDAIQTCASPVPPLQRVD